MVGGYNKLVDTYSKAPEPTNYPLTSLETRDLSYFPLQVGGPRKNTELQIMNDGTLSYSTMRHYKQGRRLQIVGRHV